MDDRIEGVRLGQGWGCPWAQVAIWGQREVYECKWDVRRGMDKLVTTCHIYALSHCQSDSRPPPYTETGAVPDTDNNERLTFKLWPFRLRGIKTIARSQS